MLYSTPQKLKLLVFYLSVSFITRIASADGELFPPEHQQRHQLGRYLVAKAVHSGPWDKDPPVHVTRFESNPDLFPYAADSGTSQKRSPTSVIEEWRAYVDDKMERYRALIVPDYSFCRTSPCNPDPNLLYDENKLIQGALLKETLNFIRAKAAWIDTVVKYSRIDVVYNANREVTLSSVTDRGPVDTSMVKPRKNEVPFSFNGGLRTGVAGRTIGLVVEAKARYYMLTSFYRFDFAKHNNIVGMEYPFRANMLMQFRSESSYYAAEDLAGVLTQNKASVQLLSLVYQF